MPRINDGRRMRSRCRRVLAGVIILIIPLLPAPARTQSADSSGIFRRELLALDAWKMNPEDASAGDTAGIDAGRLWLLGGSMFAANVGIMWYYFTTFYSPRESDRSSWHTYNDWYNVDMNVDKLGHVWGSQAYAKTLYHMFRWTNMSEKGSSFWAASIAWVYQLEMEMTDAYYKKWGFSWYDVASNTVGILWPTLQRIRPELNSFNLKMSYFPSRAMRNGWYDYVLKDYEGFTYWLAVSVHDLLPESWKSYWPPWLGVAVGYGISHSILGRNKYITAPDGSGGGTQEWFIALDYDLRKLPGDTPFLRFLKEQFNMLHLPAPTIRFSPNAIYYGLYF